MLIEVDNVDLCVGERRILERLSFSVQASERIVVLGVNGCGKTTLLRALDGLLYAASGEIRYHGQALTTSALDDSGVRAPSFRRAFRGDVALLFQNVDAMLFNSSVADEIAFTPRLLGVPDVESRVRECADAFDLGGLLTRAPFELSLGEKKRVGLAAVLAVKPKVLLLDEPTAGLDPVWSARLMDELAQREGLTVISATHNLTVAQELGVRALLLSGSAPSVRFDGPTSELLGNESLLVAAGLAHRRAPRHPGVAHLQGHVHGTD